MSKYVNCETCKGSGWVHWTDDIEPCPNCDNGLVLAEEDELTTLRDELATTQAALEASQQEIARLKTAMRESIAASIPKETNLGSCAYALVNAREVLKDALEESPKAESEDAAKTAQFKVGDKVRVKGRDDEMGIAMYYFNVPYDTIVHINERGIIQIEYGADGSISQTNYTAENFLPYSEE